MDAYDLNHCKALSRKLCLIGLLLFGVSAQAARNLDRLSLSALLCLPPLSAAPR